MRCWYPVFAELFICLGVHAILVIVLFVKAVNLCRFKLFFNLHLDAYIPFTTVNLIIFGFRYSPDELRYLPLNTALYEPPLDPELPALDSDGDSDDAEDGRGDDKRKTKGNSVRLTERCSSGKKIPFSLFHFGQFL